MGGTSGLRPHPHFHTSFGGYRIKCWKVALCHWRGSEGEGQRRGGEGGRGREGEREREGEGGRGREGEREREGMEKCQLHVP